MRICAALNRMRTQTQMDSQTKSGSHNRWLNHRMPKEVNPRKTLPRNPLQHDRILHLNRLSPLHRSRSEDKTKDRANLNNNHTANRIHEGLEQVNSKEEHTTDTQEVEVNAGEITEANTGEDIKDNIGVVTKDNTEDNMMINNSL